MQTMYYIGLDVHKRTIRYCVKDGSGSIHAEGAIPATRFDLDRWMKTLPQPWTAAMEATVEVGLQDKCSWLPGAIPLNRTAHGPLRNRTPKPMLTGIASLPVP